MQERKPAPKVTEPKKSILVVPSRVISRPDQLEGGEETEIAAQVSIPEEGGWGWVVVLASFWCYLVLDGVAFSFGSLMSDMATQLAVSDSLVLLINSVGMALYFCCGPLASALINRFGFRACVMAGSVICSCSLFFCYFLTNYALILIFYGIFAGFGYCLINMSSGLVVGFYFERLRSLAIALSTSGSSAGLMSLFPLNSYFVSLAGWQTTTLLHSSMFGTLFFVGMAYRPLLSLTVMKTTEDPTRTVTYLPNLTKAVIQPGTKAEVDAIKPTATERLFSAVSNSNFPTAAAVVEEDIVVSDSQAGPSTAVPSKLTLTPHHAQGVSRRHLKQVQSLISRTSVQDKSKHNVEVIINVEGRPKKRSCWDRLCHWEHHIPQSRPLYRDDAFYDGKLEKLPAYQKSMMDASPETKTGLEYQMAVSRAVTAGDLQERRGVFTTAVRRVLATMMDPALLKRPSFIALALNGFLIYLGFLVPYVYTKERCLSFGIDDGHATMVMTALGLSNAIGRLIVGAVADRVDPLKIYTLSCFVAGLSTLLSNISYNVYFQYGYVIVFGFFGISLSFLRSMVIVSMYGLEKLTNATGMMLLFAGLGSLISTPLAGYLKVSYGFTAAFYASGIFLIISSFVSVLMIRVLKKEKIKESIASKLTKKASPNTAEY